MCSFLTFVPGNIIMDEHSNNHTSTDFQGDLIDIVRASGHGPGVGVGVLGAASSSPNDSHHHHHHHVVSGYEEELLITNNMANNTAAAWQQQLYSSDPIMNCFGDPFSNMRDPLLHELNNMSGVNSGLFGSPNSSSNDLVNGGGGGGGFCGGANGLVAPSHHDHQEMKMMSIHHGSGIGISTSTSARPSCNIFSRMLQINPSSTTGSTNSKLPGGNTTSSHCDSALSPSPPPPPIAVASPRGINVNSSQGGCLVEDNTTGGLQISSPRNPGIKRRKSQIKKVVCIPAPAAANSRASGEVVPSDLWAWRKYGQKPIKGSPYPRGYYRCSSSKGCSARKQVERSRTDPNMLVITYTSEHNHPWPTQRNALAGSTRSQPSKNTPSSTKNSTPLGSQLQKSSTTTISSPKEEADHHNKEMMMMISKNDNNNALSPIVIGAAGSTTSTTSASVKEENVDDHHDDQDEIEKLDDQLDNTSCHDHDQFRSGEIVGLFPYRPAMPGPNTASADQDFFADLGEIDADPLNLLFSQGFPSVDHHHQQHRGMVISKGLDPFNLFDWSGSAGDNNNNINK
ncbi:WRKY domain containing protein [Parasponia andersonii]|uniref:WRKY domain containing protein n=1 Tax=Parasponia andersonii TaxID=3476 RepID=A0A2P5CRQ8_PARAD|nr:WRKY domain containing protein [Parasponia andersonii]